MAHWASLDHGGPATRPFSSFPDAPVQDTLPARFNAVLAGHADRLAVADANRKLTYAALATLARRVATALPPRAGMPAPVGILLEHEARFPAAMLGVLMAGHAYVPLDASYPAARLAAIAAHAGVVAMVAAGPLGAQARSLVSADVPVIDLDSLPFSEGRTTLASASDIASIAYTSGTTGAPKGVFQNHRGMLHDVAQYVSAIQLDAGDRLTSLYSPSTVGAVRDIWAALLTGACLHVQPPRHGAAALAAFLRAAKPTIYHSVPVLLRHLAAAEPGSFPGVRLGYIAGDRMDAGDVRAFFRLFPDALLYTGLGATEASTIYVHRFLTRAMPLDETRVPVGHAIPDRLALLLDEAGCAVPPGEIGEIWVSSPYIAQGYWRAPELTAERFSDDPDRPGWRRFRTGDLGRWRPDGLLEHLGRADQMVKLGGQRVELPAVEAALKAQPGVSEAVALVRPGAGAASQPRLVAHFVPDPAGPDVTEGGLLAALRRMLPPAMVPAALVRCVALPLLPNFKVDRAAAARLDAQHSDAPTAAWDAPELVSARVVAEAVRTVLGLAVLPGPDQDLLLLGADSLMLVELAVELERRVRRTVPLDAVMAARTPRSLGRWIDASAPDAPHDSAALVTFRVGPGAAAPLLWPHDVGGSWHKVPELLGLVPADRSWLGLRDPASYDPSGVVDSIEAQATLMVAALQAAGIAKQPGVIPIGWSFAGRQAWEIGAQMQAAGWHIPAVVVIDAPPGPVGAGLEPGDPSAPWRRAAVHRYRMAAQYHAPRAPLDLVLIRSNGHSPHLSGLPDDLGWRALARRVTIVQVPGDHLSMWDGEGLVGTAAALRKILDALGAPAQPE
ncbi:AMP-binding protein [Limobrevibacterium gyesilva]|uniref:AMP-binding protein n=1 Tax=Limobrevibacterium gyesilva TaxID=2991712 RepID=A0AA41YST6_9PROT|nr:AMP-binding protein [Limobrevibacterium gyesilva]MCW3475928.1 AMP-binding protein [Limobrevibacterium gyesilva]